MKKFLIFIFLIIPMHAKANDKLVIYTYDSFVSTWGPGPEVKKRFENLCNCELSFVSTDSAASLLSRVILEGESTKADIVLGLDMNLLDQAKNTKLFRKHSLIKIEDKLILPIKWLDDTFIPFNYGYFAFVYNNKKFKNPPSSFDELISKTNARIVIQDPRTSSPGLGLLTWMKAIYGDNAKIKWKNLNKKIITVTKGWTDSYYNIFLTGEADLVFSYTTSPAAHIMFENNYDYSSIIFKEGNYLSVEFAGIIESSEKNELANEFLEFMISEDFQSLIPITNIMYPVINIGDQLPEAYKKINKPHKSIQIDPKIINNKKEMWINEWKDSSY
ncbi:MAG: thiamine ABC transporter substrate binding subunit [Pelagibacteraceae bacterium]|nr:thiamine ABC transporter substrate binding subunit [Pelagibacteraceae bacterium]|tara:strand:+ start:14861 stop:15853 length:993 start_codon:yes stop_codon:yes gene_type:complete